jgi:hypothetical protein
MEPAKPSERKERKEVKKKTTSGGGSSGSGGGGGMSVDGGGVPKPVMNLDAQKAYIVKEWEKLQAAFEKKWCLNSGGTCNWLLDGKGKANCVRDGILYSADYVWVARSSVVRYTPQVEKNHITDAMYMWQWTRQWETDGEPDDENNVPRRLPKLDAKEFDTDVRGSCIPIPQKHWLIEKTWRLGLCAHCYNIETFIVETEERTTYYIGLSNLVRSTLSSTGTNLPS